MEGLIKYVSLIGSIIGVIIVLWKVVFSIIDKNEKTKNRLLDREYKDKETLQIKNADLQKEVELGKKRYVQIMIDTVNGNIKNLDTKFSEVHSAYIDMSKTQAVSEERYKNLLSQCENYFKMTETNVKLMERKLNGAIDTCEESKREVKSFKTRLIKINEDLIMVKSIANTMKVKGS